MTPAPVIRVAECEDLAAVLSMWGVARSSHAVTALVGHYDDRARSTWIALGSGFDAEIGRHVRNL